VSPEIASAFAAPLQKAGSPRVADLSAFGMEAVLSAPVDRPRDMNNRNSTIHLAVVHGNLTPANTNTIIVRFKSANANPMVNAWSEKVLYNEIKARKEWTNQLNFHDRTLNWYHNNTPMRNERGYFMRLFCIYTKGEPPTRPSLLHLGRHICAQLNAIKGNDTVTTLDEATCFWLDPINVVWADVIGFDEALKNLMKETSTPFPYDGFYEAHENTIHTYFHRRSLDIELADILFAPMRELHPSYETTDRTVQTASSDPPTSADAKASCDPPTKADKKIPAKPKSTKPSKEIIEIFDNTSKSGSDDASNDADNSFIDNGSYHNLRCHSMNKKRADDDDDEDSYDDSGED